MRTNTNATTYSSPKTRDNPSYLTKSPLFSSKLGNSQEKELNDLTSQYRNLEYRYALLQQEKNRNENEFRSRNELHLRTIAQLKTEVEAQNSSISGLKLEKNEWKDALEAKILENRREKAKNQEILEEIARVREEKRLLVQEKRQWEQTSDGLSAKLREKDAQIKENARIVEKLEAERRELKEKLQEEIRVSAENLSRNERKSQENERKTSELQRELARKRAELEENAEKLALLQGVSKRDSLKLREFEEKCEFLAEELARKDRDFAGLQGNFEEMLQEMRESRRIAEVLSEEKREFLKEKQRFAEEIEDLRRKLTEHQEINEKIQEILQKRRKSAFSSLKS